jgi:hypothetical protein
MAARAGNGADGRRTTPRRTTALLRIISLAAFAAGLWYLSGTAAAHAGEQPLRPVGRVVQDHVTLGARTAALRTLVDGARRVAVLRASRASTRGDDLVGVPVVPGVDRAGVEREVRDHVEQLTSGLPPEGLLPEGLPDIAVPSPENPLDMPVGAQPAAGARPVPAAGGSASAAGRAAPAAPGSTSFPGAPRATTTADAVVGTRGAGAVPPGGHGLPRATTLSAWTADSGLPGGTPGKSLSLCAVVHDAAPPPVLVCTVTAPDGRAPALRLRATEPPVSPD